ncbi:Aste57867_14993 [Aphanomyces stellatus]|uniref:Aste57867_14993 protein n=1 Tax=Aphanomyces stellatus TaxID=120398 RepID=A0A485L331_9STRA|nr:hypothetical protein As57867_014937 [Aphanomyces stellatus]VFT91807.1 Aste57867_14993 [Aphanomyces stellatus]
MSSMPKKQRKLSRKHVNAKDQFQLPPELLQRIALFIPDTNKFFAYLEAFHQEEGVLGNLQHLWALSTGGAERDRLWPSLRVDSGDVNNFKALYMPILANYPIVHVFKVFDLEFLERASESSSIAISGFPEEDSDITTLPLDAWYRTLPALRISDVTYHNMERHAAMDHLLTVLPHMPHLRALNLTCACVPSISALIDFVVSSKLTSINFTATNEHSSRTDAVITAAIDIPLTKWLEREPVVSVALGNWDLRGATTFFAALWSSKTLKELVLPHAKLPPLDSMSFGVAPISISHINLNATYDGWHLRPEDVLALAHGIAHSTCLHILSLGCNHIGPVVVKEIMHAIVQSNVCKLNLGGNDLDDVGCIVVAKGLSLTKLTNLDMRSNRITGVGALELAAALAAFPQLRNLSLAFNNIDSSGVAAVIETMGSHSGPATLDVFQSVGDPNRASLPAVAARFPQLEVMFRW